MSGFVRALFKPFTIMLRSLLMIVIIMVLTKYERVPVIATALVSIPSISEAVCEGYRRIDRKLIDVYRMNSDFNLHILFAVYLPLMSGNLKQACINAVGMGIKLAVSMEYLMQTCNSLGKAVHSSSYFNEYQDIYTYTMIMILLILLVSEFPMWIGRKIRRRQQSDLS